MRIQLVWLAVGRPPRVTDPDRSAERPLLDSLLKIDQLAHAPAHLDPAILQHREAGRVVAAILQALQSSQQDGNRVFLPDVSDDSAHLPLPFVFCLATFLMSVPPRAARTPFFGFSARRRVAHPGRFI